MVGLLLGAGITELDFLVFDTVGGGRFLGIFGTATDLIYFYYFYSFAYAYCLYYAVF